jgi:hypothetical protein
MPHYEQIRQRKRQTMDITLQRISQTKGYTPQVKLAKGIGWGLVGGITGTLVMDFALMAAMAAARLPALTCFSIVGNTVEQLFSNLGITIAGGVPTGVATHYLVGPLFGIIFGSILVKVDVLRVGSLKKGILLAVLYVEILSQPILAATPILLKMTAKDTALWFGGSFLMHFLYGVLLGTIVNCGLRLENAASHNSVLNTLD